MSGMHTISIAIKPTKLSLQPFQLTYQTNYFKEVNQINREHSMPAEKLWGDRDIHLWMESLPVTDLVPAIAVAGINQNHWGLVTLSQEKYQRHCNDHGKAQHWSDTSWKPNVQPTGSNKTQERPRKTGTYWVPWATSASKGVFLEHFLNRYLQLHFLVTPREFTQQSLQLDKHYAFIWMKS